MNAHKVWEKKKKRFLFVQSEHPLTEKASLVSSPLPHSTDISGLREERKERTEGTSLVGSW